MFFFDTVYLVGFVVSALLIIAAEFADLQCRIGREYAGSNRRSDAGFACAWGTIAAVFWPLSLPIHFCMTGFYEYGLSLDFKNGPRALCRKRSA